MTHNPSLYATTADRAELAAVKLLLQAMKTHGATAYLVNIMSGSARFARDERFGFCGRYRNVTERDASVIGCMSRARVPNYVETKRDAASQSADLPRASWPKPAPSRLRPRSSISTPS